MHIKMMYNITTFNNVFQQCEMQLLLHQPFAAYPLHPIHFSLDLLKSIYIPCREWCDWYSHRWVHIVSTPQQGSTPSILGLSVPLMQGSILGVKHNYLSLFLLFCSLNYLLQTFIGLFNNTTALFCSITFAHQNPEHRSQVSLQFATNVPPITRSHRSYDTVTVIKWFSSHNSFCLSC